MGRREDNLKPFTSEQSREKAKANGAKGGKASGEAKRKKKALREELLLLLEQDDTQKRISVALIDEALNGNKAGSVTKAFEVIRDTIGQKPIDKVMVAEVDQSIIDEVESLVLEDDETTGD